MDIFEKRVKFGPVIIIIKPGSEQNSEPEQGKRTGTRVLFFEEEAKTF
jgi:hypothetical protein